jgi:hypothetical protein
MQDVCRHLPRPAVQTRQLENLSTQFRKTNVVWLQLWGLRPDVLLQRDRTDSPLHTAGCVTVVDRLYCQDSGQ